MREFTLNQGREYVEKLEHRVSELCKVLPYHITNRTELNISNIVVFLLASTFLIESVNVS